MTSISTSSFFKTERFDHFSLAPQSKKHPSFYDRLVASTSGALEPILSYLFTQNAPLNVQKHGAKTLENAPRVTVFGDVHGELFGLIENLKNAGLVNEYAQWSGESQTVVQLGDVIDRGFFSEECWIYLENLQNQAKETHGQVIRLLGNHELNVLQGRIGLASYFIQDVLSFKEKLKADVLEKRVQLAYTDGKRLFVHAGLRSSLRERLIYELSEKRQVLVEALYIEDLVDYLNELLIEAIIRDDFSHPIFQAGYLRGGEHSQGGVLWADIEELLQSRHARDLPQVAGHNPPRHKDDPPIRITDSQGFIEVDAGMNAIYGGRRAYVVFEHPDIKVRVKNLAENEWIEQVALDAVARFSKKEDLCQNESESSIL